MQGPHVGKIVPSRVSLDGASVRVKAQHGDEYSGGPRHN
jgi:hypothetical protein